MILKFEDCESLYDGKLEHDVFDYIFVDVSKKTFELMIMEAFNMLKDRVNNNCKREISALRHINNPDRINTAVECMNDYISYMSQTGKGIPKDCKKMDFDYSILDFEYKFVMTAYKYIEKVRLNANDQR